MAFRRATFDFFGAQDVVRRKTFILLAQFVIATLLVIGVTYGVVMAYWSVGNGIANFFRTTFARPTAPFKWWDLNVFFCVAALVAAIIGGAGIHRIFRLSMPASYVMDLLGATRIHPDVPHPPTRRFVNVVEEMAIASGMPAPDTYVMTNQYGINALAVGLSVSDAAIGVTNGCINMLTRDEMQGVVAHEFSHILNGDMRLNVRLLGILYGIDFIGIIGKKMFDALIASSRGALRGMDNLPAFFSWIGLFLSLPLLVVSWIGVALGGIIRAAISRQREYLADASAVQFTRWQDGMIGALKKIGGLVYGSTVAVPAISMVSHFFFAGAMPKSFSALFSLNTHPPLTKRIRKIDTSFDGKYPYVPAHYRVDEGPLDAFDWLPKPKGARRPGQSAESGVGWDIFGKTSS